MGAIIDKMKHDAAMSAWDYIGKDPEANIPKVLDRRIISCVYGFISALLLPFPAFSTAE